MTTYKITPELQCKFCHGSGVVAEHHPYGSTYATEYLTCDCVIEQLPEDFDDYKDDIDITPNRITVQDGPEFEYDW